VTETGVGIIRRSDIQHSLSDSSRQYLAGTLRLPQELAHIPDRDLEVGLSSYQQNTSDQPHYHPRTREYQYVVQGSVLLRDLSTGQTHELSTGDFYVIQPGVAHVQKSRAGSAILFFKYPAGDDKTCVPVDPELAAWLEDLDF
jgi:quercetin dioxygenase-like cupin family protein